MQARQERNQKGRWGGIVALLALLSVMVLGLTGLSSAAGVSLQGANIVDAPDFTYEVAEVRFDEPRNISTGSGSVRVTTMVMALVKGQGFRPRATGPIVWLNGIPTLRTQVAEDGASVEAWFVESLQALADGAQSLGKWQLIYQPHEGANEVYRISPTGNPLDAGSQPVIRQLSSGNLP